MAKKRGSKPVTSEAEDYRRTRTHQDKALVQLSGVAEGGPLNGVKLRGSLVWDGTVRRIADHHYVWSGPREGGKWVWTPRSPQTIVSSTRGRIGLEKGRNW